MLRLSREFEHIRDHLHAPWLYQRPKEVPQNKRQIFSLSNLINFSYFFNSLIKLIIMLNNSGDCAIYAIKFMELDMQGLNFESLNDDIMEQLRYKMAVDIFLQDWDP